MSVQPATANWLDQKIGILNALTGGELDWRWDRNEQGFQLERASGSVRVSFRIKKFREFKSFVEAYIDGVFMGRGAMVYQMSNNAWKPEWTEAERFKKKVDEARIAREPMRATDAPVPIGFRRNDAPDRIYRSPEGSDS